MLFGEKLKFLRAYKGMTQQQLADLLGTTKQTISRYEATEREPNLRTVTEYAEKLGVPLLALIDNGCPVIRTDILKQERDRLNLDKGTFAASLGISEERYCGIEAGTIMPYIEELTNIANVICYSIDELISNVWQPDQSEHDLRIPLLSDDEQAVIRVYRSYSDIGKALCLDLLDLFHYASDEQKQAFVNMLEVTIGKQADNGEKMVSESQTSASAG